MRVLESVSFDHVLQRFRHDHAVDREHEANTNGDGESHLFLADALLGEWTRVLLGPRHLRGVVLPWHESEGGDIALVPKTGLRVADAARRLGAMRSDYSGKSPVCWRKLARVAGAPLSSIFLSVRAVTSEDYADLYIKEGLIHLDGLHRMIAWELDGLLAEHGLVEAYIAGPRDSLASIAPYAPEGWD